MADLQGFPYESMLVETDESGNPLFDRAISAATYRGFWKKYFTNGVFFSPATNFQVQAAGGMNLIVPFGEAHVEGLTVLPGDSVQAELMLPPSSTTGDRTDLIVLRVDFSLNREATIEIKKGAHDVADLQRDESLWELGLARVLVRQNASHVNQADITDLRLSEEWCGTVMEPITRTNSEVYFQQIAQMILNYGAQWADFFDNTNQSADALLAAIQMQWDTTLAGHEEEWQTFFTSKRAQTEQQIVENQALWDEFYSNITADINALIKYATIRLDQVVGLQGILDGIDYRITSQGEQISDELDEFGARVNRRLNDQDQILADGINIMQHELKPLNLLLPPDGWTEHISGNQWMQTIPVPGLLERDRFFVSVAPVSKEGWEAAGIFALDTAADGEVTFVCASPPDMSVIARLVRAESNDEVAPALPAAVENVEATNMVDGITLTFDRPNNLLAVGMVYKEGAMPEDHFDGTFVMDIDSGHVIKGLSQISGKHELYFRIMTFGHNGEMNMNPAQSAAIEYWVYDPMLRNNGWDVIERACAQGIASSIWQLGSSKDIQIGSTRYDFEIVGFDHDELSESDGRYGDPDYNGGVNKAAMTMMLVNCHSTARMHSSNVNTCSWVDSELRNGLIQTLYNTMEQQVRGHLRKVTKRTARSSADSTMVRTEDYLFVPAQMEILSTASGAHAGEGERYARFAQGASAVKRYNGNTTNWWTRSPATDYSSGFSHINTAGNRTYTSASSALGIVVALTM